MTEAVAPVSALPSASEEKIGSSTVWPFTLPCHFWPPFVGCVPPTIFVP